MKAFFAGVKRWWLRRFRGIVEPPPHAKGQGTTWQQHAAHIKLFSCQCGAPPAAFAQEDYKIMSQEHVNGCEGIWQAGISTCGCPVSEARYVKFCPHCRRGHWKQAP